MVALFLSSIICFPASSMHMMLLLERQSGGEEALTQVKSWDILEGQTLPLNTPRV